ncbi:glycosyltransferase family 39 protein [Sporosarcina gallistercoris]|uniref:Glycosyltransferase family 39 protein n=1 Tax=Sporosarcina gallistercoris TaxID=2762245 RepID=A0ABR8PM34_9BACL|nr:glycosyltransferase family 39 protein [Sporosarcina gallistercoris]MBD7909233.1 glycosyltransferase family 39 protein [Sporosarcina gallistercoris]
MNWKSILMYGTIFVAALTALFAYLLAVQVPFMNITPDGQLYYNMAENLLEGNGLINQVRVEEIIVPPLFAIILSVFAFLFKSETSFFVFQYILYGMNAILVAAIAKNFFKNNASALIVGLLYAVQTVLIRNGPQFLLTETIFITLILISVLLLKKWIDSEGSIKNAGYLIVFISFTLLFRPHLMFMFVLLGMLLLYYVWKDKKKLLIVLFGLVPIGLLMVNGMYNQHLHGEYVTLENYSGQNLYIANNPSTKVDFFATTIQEEFVEPYFYTLSEKSLPERSIILKERAKEYMLSHPVETLKNVIGKMVLFFQPLDTVDLLSMILSGVGLVAAIIFDKKRRLLHLSMLIYMIGFTSLTALGLLIGGQRYRAPLAPVYLLYIGFLPVLIARRGRSTWTTPNSDTSQKTLHIE